MGKRTNECLRCGCKFITEGKLDSATLGDRNMLYRRLCPSCVEKVKKEIITSKSINQMPKGC